MAYAPNVLVSHARKLIQLAHPLPALSVRKSSGPSVVSSFTLEITFTPHQYTLKGPRLLAETDI
jgi:hypothetical protein